MCDNSYAISPDGRSFAVEVDEQGGEHVWVYGIDRPSGQRLTTVPEGEDPIWSPDSEWVYFATVRDGNRDIWRRRADLSSAEEEALSAPKAQAPTSISSDGRWLYYETVGAGGEPDIWRLPLDGTGEPELVVEGPAAEWSGEVSPDGQYLAFMSSESGHLEVYVLDLESGRRWPISAGGGAAPQWSRTANELEHALAVRVERNRRR